MKSDLQQQLTAAIPGARLLLTALPQCPAICLHLLNGDYPQEQLTAEQATKLMDEPPYWAFCWASGQVLAAQILAQPSLVQGKSVLDFGAGSGVVAIAAKLAGASRAIACDLDPYALKASLLNAAANGVEIETCTDYEHAPDTDVITVADVFYDRCNLPLLVSMRQRFKQLIVSDSRLKGAPLEGLNIVSTIESYTVPDMSESAEFNRVTVYSGPV